MRSSLEHLPDCVERLDPETPPEWPTLTEEQEAFALEVLGGCSSYGLHP